MVAETTTKKAGNWSRPCCDCGLVLPEDNYYTSLDKRRGTISRVAYCKPCYRKRTGRWRTTNPERVKQQSKNRKPRDWSERTRKAWEADPVKKRRSIREKNLRRQYGIGVEEFEHLLALQGSLCAICGFELSTNIPVPHGKRKACLDHNHATGKNREILCDRCNVLIGMSFERIDILLTAIQYLEKHNG